MTAKITPGQLTRQLRQVLEHLQRNGISYVQKPASTEISPQVREAFSRLAALPASNEAAPSNAAATNTSGLDSGSAASADAQLPHNATAANLAATDHPSISKHAPTLAKPATTSSTSGTLAAGSAWLLPVLDDARRQSALAGLEQKVQECRQCSAIVSFRHQTVFGKGPLRPKICFIGEAPGADEDRTGQPFVGTAGQLLTKIISAMKLRREDVYILNALKCRPPQNRTPAAEEINNCGNFFHSQLETLQPEYIVCLGSVAVRALLNSDQPIGRLRGRFHQYRGAKVVITYHPAYLLRNESAKRHVWDDMKMLMAEIGN